jgi:hypothetical protein
MVLRDRKKRGAGDSIYVMPTAEMQFVAEDQTPSWGRSVPDFSTIRVNRQD